MNEREKFLFDLQGFLVVKDVLTPEEVDDLNAAVDANVDKQVEDDNSAVGDSKITHRNAQARYVYRHVVVVQAVVPNHFEILSSTRK